MLAGPHPHSLSLGVAKTRASLGPQAPSYARGAPPPLALTRRREDARLARAAGAILCSRGPTPARSHSASRRRAPRSGRRRHPMLAGPHPHSLSLGVAKTRASLGPQALLMG